MMKMKSTVLGLGGFAVIAAALSAPSAVAEVTPTAPPSSSTATFEGVSLVGPAGHTDTSNCQADGAVVTYWASPDCVTLRIVSDKWLPGFEEKIRFRGKVHASMGLEPGTRVVIQRAADGDLWTDHGEKWRKVGTAKIRDDGSFKASVEVDRVGSHTFRAKVATAVSEVKSRQLGGPSGAVNPRGANLTGMVGDAPGNVLSASASAMVGVPYYAVEFHNYIGNIFMSCRALGGTRYSGASSYEELIEDNSSVVRCIFPIIPGANGTFMMGTWMYTEQGMDNRPLDEVFSFFPQYSRSTQNKCSTTHPSGAADIGLIANLPIKPNDIIRVDIDYGGNGLSHPFANNNKAGTMNFSNGVQCMFGFYIDGNADADVETVIGNIGWADIQGVRTWFMPASDWDNPLPGLPKDTVGYLFMAKRGLNADDFRRFTEATASGNVELSNDLWSTRYAIDSGPADIRV